jgi:methylmalonyl-CoA mutase N-terminal domain/subunit
MQHEARAYFDRIERDGGMIRAIEAGFFRREIADAAFTYQREVDAKKKLIVGVNAFQEAKQKPIDILQIDDTVEKEQVAALGTIKAKRDIESAKRCLAAVKRIAGTTENLMPALLDAVRARCTVGEVMGALADVFGRYDGAAKW